MFNVANEFQALPLSSTGERLAALEAAGAAVGTGGFRNRIINGRFDHWQRGTSLSAATGARYLADRWRTSGTGTTIAPSRQTFTLGQTDVPHNPTYYHRFVTVTSAGAGNLAIVVQRIEGVGTLAGQTARLSFYAKADAAKNIAIELVQSFGTGGSPSADVTGNGSQLIALTTSWQRFEVDIALPSVSGKTLGTTGDWLELLFWFDAGSNFNARAASLGQQSGTFDIADVEVKLAVDGQENAPIEPRPKGLELTLCQRYYFKTFEQGTTPAQNVSNAAPYIGLARAAGAVAQWLRYQWPVPMRASPTVTFYNNAAANAQVRDGAAGVDCSATTATAAYEMGVNITCTGNASTVAGDLLTVHLTADAEL